MNKSFVWLCLVFFPRCREGKAPQKITLQDFAAVVPRSVVHSCRQELQSAVSKGSTLLGRNLGCLWETEGAEECQMPRSVMWCHPPHNSCSALPSALCWGVLQGGSVKCWRLQQMDTLKSWLKASRCETGLEIVEFSKIDCWFGVFFWYSSLQVFVQTIRSEKGTFFPRWKLIFTNHYLNPVVSVLCSRLTVKR